MTDELLPVAAAARSIGMTAQGLSRWVEQGWIASHGRGPRRAVLVSLAEVGEMADWRARSISQNQAARLLNVETRTVAELCSGGTLPYRQPGGVGGDWLIDRAAVEALAETRRRERDEFVSVAAAVELTGWPRWVLEEVIDEGALPVRPGPRGALLLDRQKLEAFVDERESSPEPCPVCTEPLPPGRTVHRGRCAGLAASAARHTPETQERINRLCRANLRRLRGEGWREVPQSAKVLQRSPRVVWRWVWRLGLGTVVPAGSGGQRRFLSRADVAALKTAIEQADAEWPFPGQHGDAKRHGKWHRARHGNLDGYRRRSGELAALKGRAVGRPVDATSKYQPVDDELRDRIKKLRERRDSSGRHIFSIRHIADITNVSTGSVRHVLRSVV